MSDISLSKAVRTNLLSLQNTATMMAATQDRLATGNKVNSALDNPTNFFTASSLNSRAGDLNSLIDNMANGVKTLEAADNGLTSITKTLESMQSTLRQARQDKSFQVDTFEVGADSTLKVAGGQFGESTDIKLQAPSGGEKASVSFAAAYEEPSVPNSANDATKQGVGARSVIEYGLSGNANAAGFSNGDTLKVDGKEITLTGGGGGAVAGTALSLSELQSTLQTQLGTTDYTVAEDTTNGKIIIENKDKSLASPKVEFGAGITAATYGETSFTYDAAFAGTVKVGSGATEQTIDNGGGSFADFVSALEAKAEDGNYTVVSDAATQKITLRNAEPGATAAPEISGLNETGATNASTTFDLDGASITAPSAGANASLTFTIDDETVTVDVAAGGSDMDDEAIATALQTKIGEHSVLKDKYSVEVDGTEVKLISKVAGEGQPKVEMAATPANGGTDGAAAGPTTANWNTTEAAYTAADTTGITVTRTAGTAGTSVKTLDAASHKFSVTYGNKTADINIVGRDSTAYSQENQLKSINDQLKAAGVNDLAASFDADNKLVLSATTAEAKTLAVSGTSNTLFGSKTVSTGAPAVSAYKATNAVDQFVEEINGNGATSKFLRASNDNGKLRIENLSTQELSVDFDKDGATGAATATSHKIGGNSVREGLAKQFNELKDQLNKLSDDASFNGINLLRGDQLTITFNETGNSFMQIKAGDERGINSQSLDLSDLSAVELDSDENIDKLLGNIKTSLNEVRSQSSAFGSNLSIVQNRQDFTKNMINTLETGAANLTLADMNAEAANLLALQTRQSLSSSALSMASQADQGVLQLLR